ncbi:MAG: glucose-6-phosphate dehydrogenase [Anaerolineales bacterium]|nr:glucose-6-phosphate dehydrogenase [Anaerolineales bacterium]
MSKKLPQSMVIFGASGDLTARKLIPSLFNSCRKQRLPEDINIIGFGGSPLTDEEFKNHLLEGLAKYAAFRFTKEQWQFFSRRLSYLQGSYADLESFKKLDTALKKIEGGPANRLFYLATPPTVFANIIDLLGETRQLEENNFWRRVVIEKPFGTDLASAKELNQKIHRVLDEDQIYRIDHYLGKETVQNILVIRFANTIFEPLWNRNYVDHVQITVAESVGVEHRGGYYDNVGVLRDMVQNHLLQLLSLVAMEPPASYTGNALRNEKVKVLSAVQPINSLQAVVNHTIRAQYQGYLDEPNIDPASTTPTYTALRLFINNWRWQGVPFYLRSGKKLAEKSTQIIVQFKEPPMPMFPLSSCQNCTPNTLVLYLQPDEGIHLRFEAKVPDTVAETSSVDMEFHYADSFGPSAIPEAYERLLLDALQGDTSLFTRADEVETTWGLIDPILNIWEQDQAPPVSIYPSGSWGPEEANRMLQQDHRDWLIGSKEHIRHTT